MKKLERMSRYPLHILLFFVLLTGQSFVTPFYHSQSYLSPGRRKAFESPASNIGRSFVDKPVLTVSYSIELKSRRGNTGIGETYSGGVKTVFVSYQQVRLRLVSLMRMQSILYLPDHQQRRIIILKESGKDRYKCYLTPKEWKTYNQKYEGVTCKLMDDTVTVLNYHCKKAIITLKDGKQVIAFYSPSLHNPLMGEAEPLFSCIPGLVLRYEYGTKRKSIVYTATSVSFNTISPDVFAVPGSDFPIRKFE